jgi:two-component system response regulator AtoC
MGYEVLVVDDEVDFLDSVRRGLMLSGFKNVSLENDPQRASTLFEQGKHFDIALIDVNMPGKNGVLLLEEIKNASPDTECLMITALNEARLAVECLNKGAYDYLVKPISKDDLAFAVKRALDRKRLLDISNLEKGRSIPELTHADAFGPIVTRSTRIIRILKEAELHAASDVPILITGDSGSGKELLARAIHLASLRARYPFTPVNMAAITSSLFEAEFFGHTKGAFTGADRDRTGYLEHTNRGTLFLDEIGDLSMELQGKLLRVLQEGEYLKLGISRPQRTDIRFIAATNSDIEQLMKKGLFRKDLYYRLKGAWLHLPPLRERCEDIPVLIDRFLDEFRGSTNNRGIEEDALSVLMDYAYPGGIRELRSIMQSAVNLSHGRPITRHYLPSYVNKQKPVSKGSPVCSGSPLVPLTDVEKDHILRVYENSNRNKSQSAALLGIGLNTLRRKLASYGVE